MMTNNEAHMIVMSARNAKLLARKYGTDAARTCYFKMYGESTLTLEAWALSTRTSLKSLTAQLVAFHQATRRAA